MSEKIYFNDSQKNSLCAILFEVDAENKSPIMILCHGFTTSKDNSTNTQLEEILNKSGISTFRFDFFGHGESEGDFAEISVSKGVDGILNAIQYLRNLGYEKIGLLGSSFGGAASSLAASKTNNLSLLVLKSPVSDYEEVERLRRSDKEIQEWQEKGYVAHINSAGIERRLNYSFFKDIENINIYEDAKNINIPTFIIHGNKDLSVPINQSKKLSEIIDSSKLEIIEGAGHKYSNPGEFDLMINKISEYIINNLK